MRRLKIDAFEISDESHCYVIAEIGHNHQGELAKCRDLFKAAKESGADAVKLQKRDNRSLFTKSMYDQPYTSENAFGPTYGEHREFLEFGRDEYIDLSKYAKELGLTFFSTAFDVPSADFLAQLDMPAYKIASADLRNTPLLKHVAKIGKPMIISTGGGTLEDVRRAVDAIAPINTQLAILQCTASYPCEPERLNLRVIDTLRREFPDYVIGFSAHDNGIAMPVVAFTLGARIVEKHFTLNRAWKGTDHALSLAPDGMRRLVRDLHRARDAFGDGVKRVLPEEEAPVRKMAKKLVAARTISVGHVLALADIAIKSPGDGLAPYHIDALVGRTVTRPLVEDEAFAWDMLSPSAPA
jgi:N-acetylneuraminate synthase/sialic acid synthase